IEMWTGARTMKHALNQERRAMMLARLKDDRNQSSKRLDAPQLVEPADLVAQELTGITRNSDLCDGHRRVSVDHDRDVFAPWPRCAQRNGDRAARKSREAHELSSKVGFAGTGAGCDE